MLAGAKHVQLECHDGNDTLDHDDAHCGTCVFYERIIGTCEDIYRHETLMFDMQWLLVSNMVSKPL